MQRMMRSAAVNIDCRSFPAKLCHFKAFVLRRKNKQCTVEWEYAAKTLQHQLDANRVTRLYIIQVPILHHYSLRIS